MAAEVAHHRFSLAEYEAMIKHGIVTERDWVELIAGEIVEMSPSAKPHNGCTSFLNRFFCMGLEAKAIVWIQMPIATPPNSEPRPDVALLRPRTDFYRATRPYPADVFLVVEVDGSQLSFDRALKLPVYAKAGIPEVWIVNISEATVEVYRKPSHDGYGTRMVMHGDDVVAPLSFPDLELRVGEILGY